MWVCFVLCYEQYVSEYTPYVLKYISLVIRLRTICKMEYNLFVYL